MIIMKKLKLNARNNNNPFFISKFHIVNIHNIQQYINFHSIYYCDTNKFPLIVSIKVVASNVFLNEGEYKFDFHLEAN